MFLTLFTREFRRALSTSLLVLGGACAALILAEKAYLLISSIFVGSEPRPINLWRLSPILLVTCSFGLGASTISRRVKETQVLFLQTLPLNRHWIWLALVSARVLALLLVIPMMMGVQALFWNAALRLFSAASGWLWFLISVDAFGAGLCSAALFRRTLFVYLIGGLLSLVLMMEFATRMVIFIDVLPDSNLDARSVLPVFAGVTAALFWLSCRTFVAGEFHHTRRRLKNWGLVALAVIVLFNVFQNRGFIELLSGSQWDLFRADVSPDGGFLSLIETLRGHRQISRHRVVDALTAKAVLKTELTFVESPVWMPDSKVLFLSSAIPPVTALSRLTPGVPVYVDVLDRFTIDSMSVDRRHFDSSVLEGIRAYRGQLLSLRGNPFEGSGVWLTDPHSGTEREWFRIEKSMWGSIFPFGDETLIDVPSPLGEPGQAWILTDDAKEIRSLRLPAPTMDSVLPRAGSYTVLETVHRTPADYVSALESAFGRPEGNDPSDQAAGFYVVPGDAGTNVAFLGKATPLFYLRPSGTGTAQRLFVHRPTATSWRELAQIAPFKPESLPDPGASLWIDGDLGISLETRGRRLSDHLHFDVQAIDRIAVFVDARHVPGPAMIYDSELDQVLEFGEVSELSPEQSSVGVSTVTGLDGVMVWLRPSASAAQWAVFHYRPGTGRLEPMGSVSAHPNSLIYFDTGGRRIEKDSASGSIIASSPGAKPLQLWP